MENGINRLRVHGFEAARDRSSARIASTDTEVVNVVHGYGGLGSGEDAREASTHGDGAERGFLLLVNIGDMHRPVKPSVFRRFHTRGAGFHIVLRVEMRARAIGRARGVNDGQMTIF